MKKDPHIYYHPFLKHMNEKLSLDEDNQSFSGIEAIELAEEYAESNQEIKIVPCNDSLFSGSIIVLVPHPNMGITFHFIPQLTNEQGNIFLYPHHSEKLITALQHLIRIQRRL